MPVERLRRYRFICDRCTLVREFVLTRAERSDPKQATGGWAYKKFPDHTDHVLCPNCVRARAAKDPNRKDDR